MEERETGSESEIILKPGINVLPLPALEDPYDHVMLDGREHPPTPITADEAIRRLTIFFDEVAEQGGKLVTVLSVQVAKGDWGSDGSTREQKIALIQKD